jgi:hypothetical protein
MEGKDESREGEQNVVSRWLPYKRRKKMFEAGLADQAIVQIMGWFGLYNPNSFSEYFGLYNLKRPQTVLKHAF